MPQNWEKELKEQLELARENASPNHQNGDPHYRELSLTSRLKAAPAEPGISPGKKLFVEAELFSSQLTPQK
ncbi:MAG: hypothetical protein Q8P55_01945 [bacterium]|nr:hypothetical protein [bacterium]